MLTNLQLGIPIDSRPFAELAQKLRCDQRDIFDFVAHLRNEGKVRRFGAVFDTRRLGYTSVLCAAEVPDAELDAAAAKIVDLVGVTHCYTREAEGLATPKLWFTLSYPADVFPAMSDEVVSRLAPYRVNFLPATRRYKVDVVFGAATRNRDESVEDDGIVTERDRLIIGALQGDTELREDYFAAIAGKIGIKEWDILTTLEMWRRNGRLKRIGLLLAHREAGWTANAMCCWRVEGDTREFGRALASCEEVTHCYERPMVDSFKYNLFAMIHERSRENAHATFARLEKNSGLSGGVMLFSGREYKKTSMTFFATTK